jgi:hypothetical protein
MFLLRALNEVLPHLANIASLILGPLAKPAWSLLSQQTYIPSYECSPSEFEGLLNEYTRKTLFLTKIIKF